MNVKVLHYISLGQIYYSFVENDIDVTPADVLTFITGADQEPPLGFVSTPEISFHSNGLLATASTCLLQLRLPITHNCYETFRDSLITSIKGHDGYGVV